LKFSNLVNLEKHNKGTLKLTVDLILNLLSVLLEEQVVKIKNFVEVQLDWLFLVK